MTTFVCSPKKTGSKIKTNCRRIKAGRASLNQSETLEGQNLLRVKDSANQTDFDLYGFLVTACDRSAFYLVRNKPNMFIRYQRLPKAY